MLIETDRTQLAVLSEKYAKTICDYYARNAAHLEPWEPRRSAGFHAIEAWRQRGQNAQEEFQSGRSLRLIAHLKSGSEMIAACNFTNILRGSFQACTLGYSIDAQYQGQNLMYEIISAGLAHVFGDLDMHRVMANYIPENQRSARLLERLGFEKEGLAKSYLKIAGQWRDHVLTAKVNPAHLD